MRKPLPLTSFPRLTSIIPSHIQNHRFNKTALSSAKSHSERLTILASFVNQSESNDFDGDDDDKLEIPLTEVKDDRTDLKDDLVEGYRDNTDYPKGDSNGNSKDFTADLHLNALNNENDGHSSCTNEDLPPTPDLDLKIPTHTNDGHGKGVNAAGDSDEGNDEDDMVELRRLILRYDDMEEIRRQMLGEVRGDMEELRKQMLGDMEELRRKIFELSIRMVALESEMEDAS